MLTDEQYVTLFNRHVPRIETSMVDRGIPQSLANALAVEMLLSYLNEANEAAGLNIPLHQYGVKVRLENDIDVQIWVKFPTPTLEDVS